MAKRPISKNPSSSSRKNLRKEERPYARKTDEPRKEPPADDGTKEPAAATKDAPAAAKDAPAASDASAKDAKGPGAAANDAKDPGVAAKDAAPAPAPAAKDEPPAPTPAPAAKNEPPAPAPTPAAKDEPPAPAPVSEPPSPAAADAGAAPRVEALLPPTALPEVDAGAPADPPGYAPPGDSRSLRRGSGSGEEFVFIYRVESFLISRSGTVGTQGAWQCVEYPSVGSASHAYAQECSRLTGEGYYDLP